MTLQIYLLGSFRLVVSNSVIANSQWQKRKAKLLVQILALQPLHELHREELLEMLFPEMELEKANANLYRVLYAARQALKTNQKFAASPTDYLLAEGKQIKLSSPDGLAIDVEEFEQKARLGLKNSDQSLLAEAVEVYRGDLLADEPFEDWTINKREELKHLLHRVLNRLAEMAEDEGKTEAAHFWRDKLLSREPADEDSHRAKMRLYEKEEQISLVKKQYQRCCQALQRELGVAPELQTQMLYRQILLKNREQKKQGDFREGDLL